MRILLVDDEARLADGIRRGLEAEGMVVDVAHRGGEGLRMAGDRDYDAIILDVMMPMVDGFATLEQIKKDERLQHCKVIFLSAKNKEKDIERGLSLGADLYMTKPFSVKKLVEQTNELLTD
ncbi:MAG: response regulator [Flavobacterium sp.]|nr:response regulator [Flavobacterium sp.]